MIIQRQELDRGEVDLSEIVHGERQTPIHPGEILAQEFLMPMGLGISELAQALRVPPAELNEIAQGRRAIATDTARRLARHFGTTSEFWTGLQSRYDLEAAARRDR